MFHKMWGVSWLGEDMLASEERLHLMELLRCVLCRNQVIKCCSNKHWNFEPWHFLHKYITIKGKSNPITGLDRPWAFQVDVASRFQDSQHMKLVSLSALCTGHHYPPRHCTWHSFLLEVESTPGPSAAGRISKKNSNNTIGKWTHYLPACSAVPLFLVCAMIFLQDYQMAVQNM
jgi:hypothetical protein